MPVLSRWTRGSFWGGYGFIESFIEDLGKRFHIKEIAFDRWGAVQMVQNPEGLGFTVVPFGQGFKDMSPPSKRLMELVLERNVAHGGHPVRHGGSTGSMYDERGILSF